MKRIISLIITIALIFSFSASVYAEVPKGLNDVKDHWAEKEIKDLYEKKIITGNTKGEYEPRREITKGEFTTLLVKVMEYDLIDGSSFDDVGYNRHWAKKYIETAVKEGVINPEKEGDNYWPDIPIKRFDMTLMMFKALKLEYSDNPTPFPDVDCGCVTKLHEEFLITGTPEGNRVYFKPSGLTTRAEASAIIARMVEYKENPKAYKEKKQWDTVTEDGVPMRLYLIKIDGKTIKERNRQLQEELSRPAPPWENYSMKYYERIPKETLNAMFETGKTYMNIEYNIDYRTVDESYEENIKKVISKNNWDLIKRKDIRDIKERKIVVESEFYTAEDLLYTIETKNGIAGGDYLRGTLRFRYLEPTMKSYLEKTLDANGKPLKTGQWYEQDIDIQIGRDPARMAYVIVYDIYEISKPNPIERR